MIEKQTNKKLKTSYHALTSTICFYSPVMSI